MSEIVIVVTGQTGPSGVGTTPLNDLTDVTITAAAAGDILRHNGTDWVDAVGTTHFEVAGAAAAAQAASQPLDSDLTAIAALTTTAYGRAFLALADAAAARTALTLGTIATQGAGAVSITGGSVTGITDLTIADGGTGASVAATALSNLGGQPLDTDLTAIAALTSAADKVPYSTGAGTWELADFTAAGRALVDDATAAAQRTTLGVSATNTPFTPVGTVAASDVQAAIAEVAAESVQTSALTVNANLLTRTAGVPAEITRANLAADAAFTAVFEPVQVGTNTNIGLDTQTALTTGANNSALGNSAQRFVTEGSNNTGIGLNAQREVTTGGNNVGVGVSAQRNATTGGSNSALGTNAQLNMTTAESNCAFGANAQQAVTTGSFNSAFGVNAQFAMTTGAANDAFGLSAQQSVTTGSLNVAFGISAQYQPNGVSANALTTATRCTSVGNETGFGSATQDNDVTTIGYRAIATGAGATSLGSGAHAAFTQSVALGMSTVTTAASQVHLGSRHMEMVEITAPAAGATNSARIFAEDDGAGKTRLMVRFATGAVQQLAIQP